MKKKVIVVVLCICSHSAGMQLPFLSYSIPDLVSESVYKRCATTELSSDEKCCMSTLFGYVKCNAVNDLQNYLKYKAARARCDSGYMNRLPDVLQRLLRHRSDELILHEAVERCHNHCVELLLQYNTHPNRATKGGDTPLHVARSSSMVQLLMSHGSCIECKNDCGETPFFKSIKNSCLDIAQILWTAGADVNARNKSDDTPLHHAAQYLGKEAIQFLLYRGAHIDCKNKLGKTAYQIMHERGGDALKALQEWQAVFHAINFTIEDNRTLTIMSLLEHNARQLKTILTCDVSDYCSPDIIVAEKLFKRCSDKIWDALKQVYSEEVLFLVRSIQNRSHDRKGFVDELRNNQFASAYQLLQQNPYLLHTYEGEYKKDDVNALFVDKVIFSCAKSDQYHYMQKMIHSGFFDVDGCDELGAPLLCAVIQQSDSVKYLDVLKAGARVNAQDSYGRTPLFYAVMSGNKDMVLQLLSCGAVVNKDFGAPFILENIMWKLMVDAYEKQKCCRCGTHDYDLSSIPCVNRHLRHFICTDCYEKYPQKCPICRRSMGSLLRSILR